MQGDKGPVIQPPTCIHLPSKALRGKLQAGMCRCLLRRTARLRIGTIGPLEGTLTAGAAFAGESGWVQPGAAAPHRLADLPVDRPARHVRLEQHLETGVRPPGQCYPAWLLSQVGPVYQSSLAAGWTPPHPCLSKHLASFMAVLSQLTGTAVS